jgi:hypothetical protein
MHWEYARAFARGVVPSDEEPPAWDTVVVGPAAALGTVGDVDPPEQAATATPKMTAAAGTTAISMSIFDRVRGAAVCAGSLSVTPQSQASVMLPARMGFSICRRYPLAPSIS